MGLALLLGAVALTAAPAPAVATQGDVIVTNYRYVTRIDATGARTIVSGFSNPGQDGDFNLGDTLGVAMAPNGDLFVADGGWFDNPTPSQLPESRFGDSGGIWRIDAQTGFQDAGVEQRRARDAGSAELQHARRRRDRSRREPHRHGLRERRQGLP